MIYFNMMSCMISVLVVVSMPGVYARHDGVHVLCTSLSKFVYAPGSGSGVQKTRTGRTFSFVDEKSKWK